jgi:hypothetical protein
LQNSKSLTQLSALATQNYYQIRHQTNEPILGIPQKMPIFSEIKIFWENHTVLKFLYLQLCISGKVVHYWPMQDVKYPVSAYH